MAAPKLTKEEMEAISKLNKVFEDWPQSLKLMIDSDEENLLIMKESSSYSHTSVAKFKMPFC